MIITIYMCALLIQQNIAQEWIQKEKFNKESINTQSENEDDVKDLFFRDLVGYKDAIPSFEASYISEKISEINGGLFDSNKIENNSLNSQGILEKPNITITYANTSTKYLTEPETENNMTRINDFIRFRRDLDQVSKNSDKAENMEDVEQVRKFPNLNNFFKEQQEQRRAGSMLLQEDNTVPDGFREPRGATKEQWVKQPYPVHSKTVDNGNYDDSATSSSDVRAPRVHFVTQRRLESSSPAVHRNYDREVRSRDSSKDLLLKESSRNIARLPPFRDIDKDYYPSERPLKPFEPYPPRFYNPYRDDPYYRYEEFRYDPRYGSFESDRDHPEYTHRQRRIIYYATLPEVVRSSPNVNFRNRYSHRDRYDDRYVTSPSLSVAEGNPYHFRKSYPFTKSRYDQEIERTKAPYSLKVSTDVNVREAKKNPERRIYSEPDSRYAYKTPAYQSRESFDQRS